MYKAQWNKLHHEIKKTMDDKAWIREDTLTMQLAIPPDLRIYNRHTYKNEMAQSNWCHRMAKDE